MRRKNPRLKSNEHIRAVADACREGFLPEFLTQYWHQKMQTVFAGLDSAQLSRCRHISEQLKKGIHLNTCIGVHGTSIETIELMIRKGVMPGSTDEIESATREPCDVNFYPVKSAFPDHPLREDFPSNDVIVKKAGGYAQDIGERHYVMSVLGLDLAPYFHAQIAEAISNPFGFDSEAMWDILKKHDLYPSYVDAFARRAKARLGVVFGLSKSVREKFEILNGDGGEGDLRIHCNDGFSFANVDGMIAVGKDEQAFFAKMNDMLQG